MKTRQETKLKIKPKKTRHAWGLSKRGGKKEKKGKITEKFSLFKEK